MGHILVVDDDGTVREVLSEYLRNAGLTVVEAADGESALASAFETPPDLIVLDLMLPKIDGFEVFRQIRAELGGIPVIMLTARGSEPDRILGLQTGADDYVTKPFSARELVLRVQSLLRRTQPRTTGQQANPDSTSTAVVDGDLQVDTAARRVWLAEQELALTAREFDLLAHFVTHPQVAFSREDLLHTVWGWEYGDESTVTVHIRRLREKIELDPSAPQRIATVWGVGYRWDSATGINGAGN